MDADQYQRHATRTMREEFVPPTQEQLALLNYAIGLAGEAGEVAELVKKHVFHGHTLDKDRLAKEIGDCQWYIAALAGTIKRELSDVMQQNIDKLWLRYPDAFRESDSIARRDVK